jgi:hypothetical protein
MEGSVMDMIISFIIGLIVGIATSDHIWQKHFDEMRGNILAILHDKPPAAAGRKTT